MALDRVLLTEISEKATKSVQQDQVAHMCRLILLYTLPTINTWLLTWLPQHQSKL